MDLIKSGQHLPARMEDLAQFVLIATEQLTAVRAAIRALDKMNVASEVYHQKLKEAQELANMVLDAKTRIGQLALDAPKATGYQENRGNQYITKESGETLSAQRFSTSEKQEVAVAAGVKSATLREWQQLAQHPELVEEAKQQARESDKIVGSSDALKLIKRQHKQEEIQVLKEKEVQPSTGFYDVIVIDPPWQMEKIERDVAPNQVGFDYPTMTIDEIKAMDLPAENNCHVFMWITQKHHRHGFDIFDAWGVNFICEFVWHKNGGFQPFGLPQFNHEYVMYGRIGTPTFIDFKNFFTCFYANRTGHSAKPEEFYETIRRVTAGKRIDIFNRRKIEGYDTWGNEAV